MIRFYYMMFLTHHNLQGSQTDVPTQYPELKFLTHHNLQGSQTECLEVML